ncbi:MAG TPA: hypothetical protein VK866_02345, partial [Acidimicrobiales bacterium]|nr:hypothetical protein [Acidimicrobiales bacterium]
MSTRNYRSAVEEWLSAEHDERIAIMRTALRELGEAGDERFDANTVYNMSESELREAFEEVLDSGEIAERIEAIVDAMGGDADAVAQETQDLSPVELWDYLRDLDAKAAIAQASGADTISPLPVEDVLRHSEAGFTYLAREGFLGDVAPGLTDLSHDKIREIMEQAGEQELAGEEFDWAGAIEQAKQDPIQQAVDDAGITGAAAAARRGLEDLAVSADQAGRKLVDDAANAARDGFDEAARMAERFADRTGRSVSEVTEGLMDAAGRAGAAADDLLADAIEGAGDALADSSVVGGIQATFRLPGQGGTDATDDATGHDDKMNPDQPPPGAADTRSAGDRLRDLAGDRIDERTSGTEGGSGTTRPGFGGEGTSGGSGSGGSGSGGTGSTSGLGGGFETSSGPTIVNPVAGTSGSSGGSGTGGSGDGGATAAVGAAPGGFGGRAAAGGGQAGAGLGGEAQGEAAGTVTVPAYYQNGQWYDSNDEPIDEATAAELVGADTVEAVEAAEAAAADEAAGADDGGGLETSS